MAFHLTCDVVDEDHWSLQEYRTWIESNEMLLREITNQTVPYKEISVSVDIRCDKNGSVSLPWPARAKHLWKMSVSNCILFDFLKEYNTTHYVQDSLKVLELVNVTMHNDNQEFIHVMKWRRYFPRMQFVDMSHNRIKYFSSLAENGLSNDTVGVLDLRHNNITTITPDDLQTLRIHSSSVYVDIRNNPLHCDCKLSAFVNFSKNASNELLRRYGYLSSMACATPEQYRNIIVSSLENNFCEATEFILVKGPVIALSVCVVIVIVVTGLVIKYRKELVILAFTRLHIRLPCRRIVKGEDKLYDAFIAYSEDDGQWVFGTLLPRLEMPAENGGPGFKLCIHHRDFPVGGCIVDNINAKVDESNHTVLILTNNFLRSYWCKFEFKAAFNQSIMEKKRHLIIILKEELDKRLIDADMRRCLQTFTYAKAEDKLFWDKLIFALSDRKVNLNLARIRELNNNADMVGIAVEADREMDRVNGIEQQNLAGAIIAHPEGIIIDGIWNI
ncbi:toll-like receptor Tollo [Dreissena polymorpha]|uniref:toll-like receptor Tollo n=1 Tax=Dreissena polymorpha TaxID=45954 RepID=UPI002265483F|nr:toll-like receptor Tollo [Dreissena polymorpha]